MFISPAIALIFGMKLRHYQLKRILLTLAITLFGSTILISEANDGYRHLDKVYTHYLDLSFAQFIDESEMILIMNPSPDTNDDLYIHFLSFFVGGILGAPELFFVFVSFIYAYFFSGSVLKILKLDSNSKANFFYYAFAIIFLSIKNIEGINTVRTWTGLWVLFYSVLSYFETKNPKYLLLSLLPPFFHIGFFVMIVPAWVVIFFGSRFKLVFSIMFILSFFYSLNNSYIVDNLSRTELGRSKVQAYYIEEDANNGENRVQKSNDAWYRRLYRAGIDRYPRDILVIYLIVSGIYFYSMTSLEQKLFSIGILTVTLSNLSSFIYALSNRASVVGSVFILSSFVLLLRRGVFLKENSSNYFFTSTLFFIIIFLYIPFVVFRLAELIYYISFFMLFFPFIPWIFDETNLSIRQFIGKIL